MESDRSDMNEALWATVGSRSRCLRVVERNAGSALSVCVSWSFVMPSATRGARRRPWFAEREAESASSVFESESVARMSDPGMNAAFLSERHAFEVVVLLVEETHGDPRVSDEVGASRMARRVCPAGGCARRMGGRRVEFWIPTWMTVEFRGRFAGRASAGDEGAL